jgi:DNA-binding CsgD family transcriptional regulator
VGSDELVTQGQAALRRGDAAAARAAFEQAAPSPAVLEGLAAASFVLLEYPRAIDEMERAYAGYRAGGDGSGAARVARLLAGLYGSTAGDWAVAGGWIARARTLLAECNSISERGWVALTEGMFAEQRSRKDDAFREALEIGRETGDADLTFAALAYLGASLVHGDRTDEGMALLDEALAAVAGDEVDSVMVAEEIFCQLFSACEHARDIGRAEQWIRVGEQIAARRRLPSVSAYCHTHYGGILTAAGRWPEAEATLTQAVRLWTLSRRTLRADALTRLADLRIKQGRYDEAGTLLEGLSDAEASRQWAALHLARGEHALALAVLEPALRQMDPGSSLCLPLLALLADAQLAAGEDPRGTIDTMRACAQAHPTPYARAVVACANGRAGYDEPANWLRIAQDEFTRAQLPLEAAICRLDLAGTCIQDNPELAVKEARAALRTFRTLDAARYSDAAAALLRRLGQKVGPPRSGSDILTKRELEVLQLLGEGLSNPEISERLFISRKTVEHHVGNILVKLGLRNRAEAAAYAVRQGFAVE